MDMSYEEAASLAWMRAAEVFENMGPGMLSPVAAAFLRGDATQMPAAGPYDRRGMSAPAAPRPTSALGGGRRPLDRVDARDRCRDRSL